MPRVGQDEFSEQWKLLRIYQERYPIDHLLAQIHSLERSIARRRARQAAVRRRLADLESQIEEVRAESGAIAAEIEGSRAAGALLIEDIVDRAKQENHEGWSPTPVRGYRVWSIRANAIFGNQTQWHTPTLEGRCLRKIPGEDIPHSMERCGPPACGIYAVKDLDMFPSDVASGQINETVVGVAEMAGKVVEHELGYRAQRVTAVAAVANLGGRRVVITETSEIASLFTDPGETVKRLTSETDPSPQQARELLESIQTKEGSWT